jgi:hypothetical protein
VGNGETAAMLEVHIPADGVRTMQDEHYGFYQPFSYNVGLMRIKELFGTGPAGRE